VSFIKAVVSSWLEAAKVKTNEKDDKWINMMKREKYLQVQNALKRRLGLGII